MTLDDDLAGLLKRRSVEFGKPFKQVINDTLRRGLTQEISSNPTTTVQVRPHDFGRLRPGLDPDRMNQLYDELEVEAFLEKQRKVAGRTKT